MNKTIRAKIGNYRFLKAIRAVKRKTEVMNFDEAKKIGLLYDATNEKDYEIVKGFVKRTRNQNREVLALGYVDKKELPAKQFPQFGLDFFSRKNLNWHMIPENPVVKNFINEEFDILIQLNGRKIFPLRYVLASSKAKFRVGRFDQKQTQFFDLMISTHSERGISGFIEEAERYLKLIKK